MSAVSAAMAALQAAVQRELAEGIVVGLGFPTDLETAPRAIFVTGQVSDWRQQWVTTQQGTPLTGLRAESFLLQVFLFRRGVGMSTLDLMSEMDPWRESVEAALRADRTLGGTLGNGIAQVESMQQDESTPGERARELGLTISVRCDAEI